MGQEFEIPVLGEGRSAGGETWFAQILGKSTVDGALPKAADWFGDAP